MFNIKSFSILLFLSSLSIINLDAQNLDIEGGAKINTLATDNAADKLVAITLDGTLVAREASSLGGGGGGGLTGIEKVTDMTIAENVVDNGFHSQVALAVCPVGKFVIGGLCTDTSTGSSNDLVDWGVGGSGTTSQYTGTAYGRSFGCRSRNTTGGTLNNLQITATAICATVP